MADAFTPLKLATGDRTAQSITQSKSPSDQDSYESFPGQDKFSGAKPSEEAHPLYGQQALWYFEDDDPIIKNKFYAMEAPEQTKQLQGYIGYIHGLIWSKKQFRYMTKTQYIKSVSTRGKRLLRSGKAVLATGGARAIESQRNEARQGRYDKLRHMYPSYQGQEASIQENLVYSTTDNMFMRELGASNTDLQAVKFAQGLIWKGKTHLRDPNGREEARAMLVMKTGSRTQTVAYLGTKLGPVVAEYLEPDQKKNLVSHGTQWHSRGSYTACPFTVSSISCIHTRDKIVLTRDEWNRGVCVLSPYMDEPTETESEGTETGAPWRWDLSQYAGRFSNYVVPPHTQFGGRRMLASAPGHSSSSAAASIGTTFGMLLLSYDDRLISFRPDDQDRRGVYCVDFKKGSRDVVYAGTDNDLLWLLDLRQRWREGSWISTPGGVRRTFSVSDHQVLAACSEGMHIYDVRALRSSHLNPMQAEIPVVDFPEWYNSSSRPGVAVETDYGVVAASQSEGSPVGLYSLKTGKPLASPMLDAYRPTQRSISALSFSYLWNEDSPSLMFGDGYSICKFSPSRAHDRDEEDDESLWE